MSFEIFRVHHRAESQLFEVVDAADSLGLPFGPGESRQQQCSKNRDDCDYDQQFDQGESAAASAASICTASLKLLFHHLVRECFEIPFTSARQARFEAAPATAIFFKTAQGYTTR